MLVKEGYKETEIGVIPKDWGLTSAKNLMKIETGSRNTEHKSDNGKYLFFVRSQQVERIDSYHYDCEAVLTAGDGVGTGKVFHYINGKFDAHQRVYVMSQFKDISGRFFYNYFKENFGNEVAKYTAKSSVDSVRRDMIAEMLIPVPSPEEQQKIAEALSDMDNLIAALEKLIEKKKAIKQGAMQELLTGEKRLPRFSGEWENKNLSEIADFHDNLRVPVAESLRETGNTPYYGANGIQGYIKGFTHNGEFVLVAEDGASDLKNYPVRYVSGKIWVNNHAHVLQGKDLIADTLFLSYLLSQYDFQSILVGGTRAKLNGSMIKKLNLMLPDMDEQKAIASILSEMDAEITALEQKLAKCQKLKQGMMQQLLTGKIRLI